MAKAELRFATKTKRETRQVESVYEVKKVSGVTLTLTCHEARALHTVLRLVGGDPETSLRRPLARIEESLQGLGTGYYTDPKTGYSFTLAVRGEDNIYFRDGTDVPPGLTGENLPEPEPVHVGHNEAKTPHTYKVGDKVRIKSGLTVGVAHDGFYTTRQMVRMAGEVHEVTEVSFGRYKAGEWWWKFHMVEPVEEEPALRVGAKIKVVKPWGPQGYEEGDILTVRHIDSWGDVNVADAKPPFNYPAHPTGAFLTRHEFIVLG